MGKAAAMTLVATPIVDALGTVSIHAQAQPLAAVAGIDRVVMLKGKTYLSGWTGYGAPPRRGTSRRRRPRCRGSGLHQSIQVPAPKTAWAKVSGPGDVVFGRRNGGRHDRDVLKDRATTCCRSPPTTGRRRRRRILRSRSSCHRRRRPLAPVFTTSYSITSPFWSSRVKALIVNWIPHCVDQCNRTDLVQGSGSGAGGLDNFIEAGKALRGEPHGKHKGYVFSNAWVHQTVESICLALMVDPQGDAEITCGAEEPQGDTRGLDSEDSVRAASRRLPADRVHVA
jgi:hypothetical protein